MSKRPGLRQRQGEQPPEKEESEGESIEDPFVDPTGPVGTEAKPSGSEHGSRGGTTTPKATKRRSTDVTPQLWQEDSSDSDGGYDFTFNAPGPYRAVDVVLEPPRGGLPPLTPTWKAIRRTVPLIHTTATEVSELLSNIHDRDFFSLRTLYERLSRFRDQFEEATDTGRRRHVKIPPRQ